jgi:hypothetical protein
MYSLGTVSTSSLLVRSLDLQAVPTLRFAYRAVRMFWFTHIVRCAYECFGLHWSGAYRSSSDFLSALVGWFVCHTIFDISCNGVRRLYTNASSIVFRLKYKLLLSIIYVSKSSFSILSRISTFGR